MREGPSDNSQVGHGQWRRKLENFEGDGDKNIGVKGGYSHENSSVLAPYLLPMGNFYIFLDFSFPFFIFPSYFLPPRNFRRGRSPTENFRRGHVPRPPGSAACGHGFRNLKCHIARFTICHVDYRVFLFCSCDNPIISYRPTAEAISLPLKNILGT